VQGLRGVAILLVVLYHAGARWLGGGFTGVDVFFVISGFVITAQLLREIEGTGRLSVPRFYARRVLRLIPAAATVTAGTVAAAWYWLPPTRLSGIATDALFASTSALNYRLAVLGTNYQSAGAAPSPLQHYWSLGVEEQFYLVWPVLLLLLTTRLRRRAELAVVLAVLAGTSLWWSVRLTARSAVWAYYGAPTRVWELAAGALVAVLAGFLRRTPRALAVPVRWAGLVTIGWGATHLGAATPFPGYLALLPVAGAAAVIWAGCSAPGKMLQASALTWLGDHSYGWYLWHWPFLIIGPYALARPFGLRENLIASAAALAAALLARHVVETPIRNNPALRGRALLAAATGLGLTSGAVAVTIVLPLLPPRIPLGIGSVAAVTLDGTGTVATRALARQLQEATLTARLPANLTPSLGQAALDTPDIYRDGCHLTFRQITWPAACERLGDPRSATLIVLFGDSHAAQWYPAIAAIAAHRHWRLAVFTKSACSAAGVKIYLDVLKRPYDECVAWRSAVLSRIQALHPVIVVTSSNADGGTPLGVPGDTDAAWAQAWSATLTRLTGPHRRVYYLNDTPWPKTNVPDCLSAHPRDIQVCARDTASATAGPRRAMMAGAAAHAGAVLVDPTPWFCTLRSCPVVVGNVLVYQDASHMSTAYARLVGRLLAEQVG
jgi:peptidoglycan/LPS O-acetylase OafA/YrhL